MVLYQLSYSRVREAEYSGRELPVNQIFLFRTFRRSSDISSFSPAGCAVHVNPSHDRPRPHFRPSPARFHE